MVVGDAHRPPLLRRVARHCHVAAKVHEHARLRISAAAPAAARSAARAFAVAPRSSSTPRGTRTAPRRSSTSIDRQPGVATTVTRRSPFAELREVAVVARQAQRAADRRIDVAVGESSGAKRDLQRGKKQRADRHPAALCAIDASQLGVVAKAATGEVDLGELRDDESAHVGQRRRLSHEDRHLRAERLPARRCRRSRGAKTVTGSRTSRNRPAARVGRRRRLLGRLQVGRRGALIALRRWMARRTAGVLSLGCGCVGLEGDALAGDRARRARPPRRGSRSGRSSRPRSSRSAATPSAAQRRARHARAAAPGQDAGPPAVAGAGHREASPSTEFWARP